MKGSWERVVITGGAGFIGSHLARRLIDQNKKICIIDDLSTGSIQNIKDVVRSDRCRFIRGSVLDGDAVGRALWWGDLVIHLAAAVGVEMIVDDPVRTINTNVHGTQVVLEQAKKYGNAVVVASSSEVYGKGVEVPFKEDDNLLLGPTDKSRWCYGASKILDEYLAFAYRDEYEVPTIAVRLFNTIGAGQSGEYGMVVPRFVSQAIRGEPLTVYGNGHQTRCFCDVDDTVEAIVRLSEHEDTWGHVFNIGSEREITINDLANLVIEIVGSGSRLRHIDYEEAYGSGFEDLDRRVPSVKKISRFVGWERNVTLEESIAQVRQEIEQGLGG